METTKFIPKSVIPVCNQNNLTDDGLKDASSRQSFRKEKRDGKEHMRGVVCVSD